MQGLALGLAAGMPAGAADNPIQLHVELEVDPAREQELVANFRNVFRPAIWKQPGFVSVRLLKLRSAVVGTPPGAGYRLAISFQTEEQRQVWVKSDDHQKAWPAIEQTLRPGKVTAVLYDVV